MSLLLLPDELLTLVLLDLYFDIFGGDQWHKSECRAKLLKPCCCYRSGKAKCWFWNTLPLVHPRIWALLGTGISRSVPILKIPAGHMLISSAENWIIHMALPSFAPTLARIRHLRIDYFGMKRPYLSHDYALNRALRYVGHLYLICLSAKNIRSLELNDFHFRRTSDSDDSENEPRTDIKLFKGVKPLHLDMTCRGLLERIPVIFQSFYTTMPPNERERWSPAAAQQLGQRLERIVNGPESCIFQHLKDAYIMEEWNKAPDYSNFFIKPARTLRNPDKACHSSKACSCISLCPSLRMLSILEWHMEFDVDAAFLRGLAHLARVHPRLWHLTVTAYKFRVPCSPKEEEHFSRWFEATIRPVLQLANEILPKELHKCFRLVTTPCIDKDVQDYIERYRPGSPGVHLDTLIGGKDNYVWGTRLWSYDIDEVHEAALDDFRAMCNARERGDLALAGLQSTE